MRWQRVEAYGAETGRRNVLHIIDRERIGQRRGVPMLAPVLEAIKQLGRYTDAEIMAAVNHGVKVIKFFPANVYGGLNAMKSLSAPFVGIRFLPTGGVNTANIREYINAPFVHAVGGSWLCPKAEIAAGHFEQITARCREASGIVREVRG